MTKNYSRLQKTENRRATRSIVLYAIMTIVALFLLLRFGLAYLFKFTNYLGSLSGREVKTEEKLSTLLPPTLEELPEHTKDAEIRVKGRTKPGQTVFVFVNTNKKEVLADAEGEFNALVTIDKDNENNIYAYVSDNLGQNSANSREFTVKFDDQAPKVEIINIVSGITFYGENERNKKIEGQTEVDAKLTINGRLAIINNEGKFNFPIRLNDGENKFTLIAVDPAGNETKVEDFIINFSL